MHSRGGRVQVGGVELARHHPVQRVGGVVERQRRHVDGARHLAARAAVRVRAHHGVEPRVAPDKYSVD